MNQNMLPIFAQKTAARVADSLHDENRIGLNRRARFAVRAVSFRHGHGEVASVRRACKGENPYYPAP